MACLEFSNLTMKFTPINQKPISLGPIKKWAITFKWLRLNFVSKSQSPTESIITLWAGINHKKIYQNPNGYNITIKNFHLKFFYIIFSFSKLFDIWNFSMINLLQKLDYLITAIYSIIDWSRLILINLLKDENNRNYIVISRIEYVHLCLYTHI